MNMINWLKSIFRYPKVRIITRKNGVDGNTFLVKYTSSFGPWNSVFLYTVDTEETIDFYCTFYSDKAEFKTRTEAERLIETVKREFLI